jgi:predicted ATP-grasp superfamily ATP-dependent carboligase
MHVFVYESTCAEWLPEGSHAAALRTEGAAILTAVVADLRRVPGVEVSTLLAESCPADLLGLSGRRVRRGEEEKAFRTAARAADGTLVIAPEFGALLLCRCRWVEEEGGRLLGPSSLGVELTADKLALARHWRAHGTPTPPCWVWRPGRPPPPVEFPAVCKPRHGAGSGATFLLRRPEDLAGCETAAREEAGDDDLLLQPFVAGQPASVALILGPWQEVALLPAAQHLSGDGRFRYLGGQVPLPPELGERARRLALRAVRTVPGLLGYVGVDLVLGDAANGSRDFAVEINPRPTTSYVGLRALAQTNLAEALLRVAFDDLEGMAPRVVWHPGGVRFRADGTVETIPATV